MEKIVTFNGRNYKFRECDTKDLTQEEMQRMTDEYGKKKYEPNASWLYVRVSVMVGKWNKKTV